MLARAMWIEVLRAMNRYRSMAGLAPIDPGEPEGEDPTTSDAASGQDPSPSPTSQGNL
jgi:hypothetical protein